MISNTSMDSFLSGKMCFAKGEGAHSKYFLREQLGLCIPAVLPIQLQHGRGDVSKHIVMQIRSFFDVSERQLSDAIKCDYSMLVLYCSFLVSKTASFLESARTEPVVYERTLIAFIETIPTFMARATSLHNPRRLHRGDKKLAGGLRQKLSSLTTAGSGASGIVQQKLGRAVAAILSALDVLDPATQ